jgi:hypothetical protein
LSHLHSNLTGFEVAINMKRVFNYVSRKFREAVKYYTRCTTIQQCGQPPCNVVLIQIKEHEQDCHTTKHENSISKTTNRTSTWLQHSINLKRTQGSRNCLERLTCTLEDGQLSRNIQRIFEANRGSVNMNRT